MCVTPYSRTTGTLQSACAHERGTTSRASRLGPLDPRSEDPATIRAAILEGVRTQRPSGTDVHEATSRAQAIRDALALATDQDTVIVTGKGHEPTQEIAGVFHRYNDRDVYLAAKAERSRARAEQHA